MLCHPLASGLWDFRLPRGDIDMPTADFLLHVLPGVRDAYADAMAAEIDRWDRNNFLTPDILRERLQLDASIYHGFLSCWLDTLFARGGYGRDSRGYLYGPGMTLPPGKKARRSRRYDTTSRQVFCWNTLCILSMVEIVFFSVLWLFGCVGGAWSQLAWVLPALVGLGCQWMVWRLRNRSVR